MTIPSLSSSGFQMWTECGCTGRFCRGKNKGSLRIFMLAMSLYINELITPIPVIDNICFDCRCEMRLAITGHHLVLTPRKNGKIEEMKVKVPFFIGVYYRNICF